MVDRQIFGVKAIALSAALLLTGGCQLTKPMLNDDNLVGLEAEFKALESLVAATRNDVQDLNNKQADQLSDLNKRLKVIDGGVKQVPTLISNACQRPETVQAACDDSAMQVVVSQDEKMILGEAEHLWIGPPGLYLTASIDTGTTSNSIHATDVTPFERDGEDWVRFELGSKDQRKEDEAVVVEKKVERLLRVSKRPVVRLRVKLGNVFDSFDFILSDRSDDDHQVLLGRNFLQDIALVDVGKQFVQPRTESTEAQ